MKNQGEKLYAIYKNGEHKGNQRGKSKIDVIRQYVIDSDFQSFLNDIEFMQQYKAIIAIEKIHYF